MYDISTFISENQNVSEQLLNLSINIITDFENVLINKNNIHSTIYKIPVCYEKCYGLDLENISINNKISCEEIIQIHTAFEYDVYSIGFLPGFTYMGKVNDKIKIDRHNKPRSEVIAGSIGIAGLQTGIYPTNSPGGWQIIGRTPFKIFDLDPNKLAKFKVGDSVQFYAISKQEFEKLNEYD